MTASNMVFPLSFLHGLLLENACVGLQFPHPRLLLRLQGRTESICKSTDISAK